MKTSRPTFVATALALSAIALLPGPATAAPGVALALAAGPASAAAPALNPDHPDSYTVKRGDTLWGISSIFLKDPWHWPDIWYANPQVQNPHLIYPGDVLTLVYVEGKPRLQVQRAEVQAGSTEKLSPRVRESTLESAIPAIPLEVIGAFLSRGSVLQPEEIRKAPYVVSIRGQHIIGAAGNELYVRGKVAGVDHGYSVVKAGRPLVDPEDGDVLGYEGIYVGAATVRRVGDPSTIFLTDSTREAMEGDRLISQQVSFPSEFVPKAPVKPVEGAIMAVMDGVSLVGQYQVIVINRGSRQGLEPGSVLRVWQAGRTVTDTSKPGRISRNVDLPEEAAGLAMVFRTYPRMSYALVMRATSEMHVKDIVRSP
ncbi:MAG: LysM peptidoglycan-binding domain-containing protein [Gammaproteobacteria bacterium]|nr:LysM peptidoglycan-binding domain-containing protein [Gammaproteobacteria bacterium]